MCPMACMQYSKGLKDPLMHSRQGHTPHLLQQLVLLHLHLLSSLHQVHDSPLARRYDEEMGEIGAWEHAGQLSMDLGWALCIDWMALIV